uniref:Centromere protein N n=1 Tax=Prolemur simus TaxID=1328070 RepID=A0A8C8Z7H8_PROSS
MDETVAEFIKRTILKIPMTEMTTILKAWDFLSENQLQTVNFRQRKESVVQHLVELCEVTMLQVIGLEQRANPLGFSFFLVQKGFKLLNCEVMRAVYYCSVL